MAFNKASIRRLHFWLAPLWVLPIVLTLLTGVLFQVADLMGNAPDYLWLLEAHKGNFGAIQLEVVYPFINAFGLLMLAVTGIMMWLQTRKRRLR
ncbi:PepSY domain-containing protein [Synechococcales cyanobacterium C]|uniref:PepSY domain-containing protein n=1 Tax=Petrachloros mirabilis ULC683 TaxID=2781853 RepID=A0A8K2A1V1_9CYAN|nr:PepSY domain-containing protein [Petrachloros mirabilis]NCJ08292.1 PepSY domain-containing protein [Petrachloros mirabilis ULC683]